LTGLGGGVVIVPMLTLLFKVDMRYQRDNEAPAPAE
jgi:uncharacterized membrane protein YfcA